LDGVDAVIHLAARVGLGVDVDDLPDYADTNVHGSAVLLAAMAAADVGRMVLASSMVIYGEGRGRCVTHGDVTPGPRRESHLRRREFEPRCPQCDHTLAPTLVAEGTPPDPRNGYATTKLAQEHLAAGWARTTGGLVSALRYHNVYGPGMPRDTPYAGVAAIFLAALRRGERPQVFEDGGQRRDFVHVRDVADATVTALERPADVPFLALNVGSGRPRTVGEFASALATATGGPPPVVTGSYRLGDVRHITADPSKLRTLLGWTPSVPFTSGVAELAGH
jgi:dTDP-L-rhamnose 4-epimerase